MSGTPSGSAAPGAPFPLIVGCARSGTTLLRAMLDAHPALAISPESDFVLWIARRRTRYEGTDGFDLEAFRDDLTAHGSFREWAGARAAVEESLDRAQPDTVPAAMRAVLAGYAAHAGKPRAGMKTPYFVRWISQVSTVLPDARVIHLIRDGRDVTLSLQGVGFGPQNAVQGAVHWVSRVEAGRRQGRALGPERYLEVRYERLVADPEGELRAICDFLGIAFDEAMLSHAAGADRVIASTRVPERHANVRRPPTAGLRDWRREMSDDDVGEFELIAGDLLDELGYARGRPAAPDARRAQVQLVAAEVLRLRRRAFRQQQRARRAGRRLRRLRSSRWGRLGRRLARLRGRAGRRAPA